MTHPIHTHPLTFLTAGSAAVNSQYLWSGDESTATKVLRVFEHQEEVDMTDEDAKQLVPTSAFHQYIHCTRTCTLCPF